MNSTAKRTAPPLNSAGIKARTCAVCGQTRGAITCYRIGRITIYAHPKCAKRKQARA